MTPETLRDRLNRLILARQEEEWRRLCLDMVIFIWIVLALLFVFMGAALFVCWKR